MCTEEVGSERLKPSVKHDGDSVVVWGCISAKGIGDLVKIDEITDTEKDFDPPCNTNKKFNKSTLG